MTEETTSCYDVVTSSSDNNALREKYRNRTLINERYIFEKKIGMGSFGSVYRGRNIISNDGVAIKFEATTAKLPTLLWESKILNHLSGTPGVVKLRYFGVESNKNIIVMDLFSHNLAEEIKRLKTDEVAGSNCKTKIENTGSGSQEEIILDKDNINTETNISSEPDKQDGMDVSTHNKSPSSSGSDEGVNKRSDGLERPAGLERPDGLDGYIKKLPPYTKEVIGYLIEMLQIISRVHDAGIVHRDIKPENFMICFPKSDNESKESDCKRLRIIDFGLSKFYKKGDKHVINTSDRSIVGTMRYISTHIHDGNVYSRRDDIISIMYVSIYLLKGTLPWCGMSPKKDDKLTKEQMVYNKKVQATLNEVCEGIPALFMKLLEYAYRLEYEEKPDYLYMIRQCKLLMRVL